MARGTHGIQVQASDLGCGLIPARYEEEDWYSQLPSHAENHQVPIEEIGCSKPRATLGVVLVAIGACLVNDQIRPVQPQ